MRPSDVVNLRFQNIDFQAKRIMINQVKTTEFLSLPLLEIVELALEDYIAQVRKAENNSDCIFLTAFAPYRPLSRAEISTIIKFAIRKSGVEIKWALCIACFLGQFNGKRWTSL
ncbi:tyrosine-type recombinase/integrase [Acutalibacter muris]|uniref:tyrosine-type recombinase/integrase n=1 Tax=Acutalibacter muris TaxID=1796620 RepID=UPI0039B8A89D